MTEPGAHAHLHPTRRLVPRLATTMFFGIMITACATLNDPMSDHLPVSPGTTAPAQITPPVSPEVYEAELRGVGDGLKAAVGGLGAAAPLDPLAGQVDSAASAVHTAAQRLTAIVPPAQYAAAHADLVSALDQLASQLSGVEAQVQSRELCAAPSVMATVSTLSGTDALRRAAPTVGTDGRARRSGPDRSSPSPGTIAGPPGGQRESLTGPRLRKG